MKKTITILNIFIILLLVSACSNNVARKDSELKEQSKAKVKTTTINYSAFTTTIKLVSETEPVNDLNLSSQVGGVVEYALPEVGSQVVKGQVLMKVDTKIARERHLMAKYAYETAKSNFTRQKYLYVRHLAPSQNYEIAFSQYKSAEAQLAIAKLGYDNSIILAPINGTITAKYFDVGEMCAPGVPIYNLVDLHKIKIIVGGLEYDLAKIKNKNISIRIPSINKYFIGTIKSIGVKADPRTKTFPVEIVFNNPNNLVKAGMIAEVTIPINYYANAIVIRLDYVIDKGPEQYVYTVKNGKAKLTSVVLGAREKNQVLVLKGLEPGDEIITEGQKIIDDGEEVEIER